MSELINIIRHNNIAEVSLNRPAALNAFNLEMVTLLAESLVGVSADDSVSGVVISGNGKAFCAGGDLKWASDQQISSSRALQMLAAQFHVAILEIRRMTKPVVAAIHGTAAGGGFSLALACDFRIMENSALFKQAYTSNGLCVDGGGTFTLPKLVGYARALEIVAFDHPVSAQKAFDWGLVTKVVEDGTSVTESVSMLNEVAKGSLHSFGWAKKLITDSFANSFESHMEMERYALTDCAGHADGREGINAFLEKRKPVFGKYSSE